MYISTNNSTINWAQLQLLCRRGMLELDLLLEQFLWHNRMFITNYEYQLLDLFLSYPDQDLWSWLVLGESSYPPQFANLVAKIRAYQR